MSVKLLTEQHLEFLSLKGGCTGSYESTLVKMPHCWKTHIVAQLCNTSSNNSMCPSFVFIDRKNVVEQIRLHVSCELSSGSQYQAIFHKKEKQILQFLFTVNKRWYLSNKTSTYL